MECVIGKCDGATSHSVTHSCLESSTLPLPSNPDNLRWSTEIFDGLHIPVLRKLTLALRCCPTKSDVNNGSVCLPADGNKLKETGTL
jgi:hypothetical protein